jgi:hypothetical protein
MSTVPEPQPLQGDLQTFLAAVTQQQTDQAALTGLQSQLASLQTQITAAQSTVAGDQTAVASAYNKVVADLQALEASGTASPSLVAALRAHRAGPRAITAGTFLQVLQTIVTELPTLAPIATNILKILQGGATASA